MAEKLGAQTIALSRPPVFAGWGSTVGQKEGRGPLGRYFDHVDRDDRFGQSTWEQSEREMQKQVLRLAELRAGPGTEAHFAGDLLNQCAASSYAARERSLPFFGLYNACATLGEGLILAALALESGALRQVSAAASSHFCTAERQYRMPLEYGGQRPPTAQWTVTGAGAVVLAAQGHGPRITHLTPGRVVDLGVTDTCNMGAAMAPAACSTIAAHLRDTGRSPDFYDLIVTGDLGLTGCGLLLELLGREGFPSLNNQADCGCLIFDRETQDVHCGGSGAGCCAAVLAGYFLPGLAAGRWKHILFCPTGALHSPTTALQGESIPGICHALSLSAPDQEVK